METTIRGGLTMEGFNLETLQKAYGTESGKIQNLVTKLVNEGVDAKMVKRLSKEEYHELEFNTSSEQVERKASEDYLELMKIAVDSDDKTWFNNLARIQSVLIKREDSLKRHLGI